MSRVWSPKGVATGGPTSRAAPISGWDLPNRMISGNSKHFGLLPELIESNFSVGKNFNW
jgi:hypothetical protein